MATTKTEANGASPSAEFDNQMEQPPKSDRSEQDAPVQAIQSLLDKHRDEHQIILLQDFPDPDALSSAWTYKLIASTYDIECDIFYAGTLSHQENIALVRLTGLPARRWTLANHEGPDLSQYQGVVLIDNQGTTSQLFPHVERSGYPAGFSD
jgi:nanoRNase/pAp phosphatase (c-di-AMP/oligoRNAs hydrolase)